MSPVYSVLMAWNRWEWLEGLEPESLVDASVRHMAGLIADALVDWPPEVAAYDSTDERVADLLSPGSPRPAAEAYEEAIRRVRWELDRDFDAIDHYERNHLLERACPNERDRRAAEFIQHYVLESFYFLMERTDYRVKRKDVRPGVDLVERRLALRFETG